MGQYYQSWDILDQVVHNITYEDGSSFVLTRDDESNHCVLHCYITAPNTYRDDRRPRPTNHEFLVPCATYNYENWRRWVFECLKTIAIHEVCEWFKDSGVRVFGPHHGNGENPYVEWHLGTLEQIQKSPGED